MERRERETLAHAVQDPVALLALDTFEDERRIGSGERGRHLEERHGRTRPCRHVEFVQACATCATGKCGFSGGSTKWNQAIKASMSGVLSEIDGALYRSGVRAVNMVPRRAQAGLRAAAVVNTAIMSTLQVTVKRFVRKHGGVRPAARALGTDHAYVWRLMNGVMDNPDEALLAKLGLERRVIYRRVGNPGGLTV